jgi:hypothetical protein
MSRIRLALLFLLFTIVGAQLGRMDWTSQPTEMPLSTYYAKNHAQPRIEPKPHNPIIAAAHKTTHLLETGDITGGGHCSATAIGPHALLTASHCEAPNDTIGIDGNEYKLLAPPIRDTFDHSIFYVNATFTEWATISTEPAQVGDDIFLFGNPGKWDDIFRKGYVAAVPEENGEPVAYDFNGFPGDSGSGIFNAQGQLVGVCSIGLIQGKPGTAWPSMRLMGGWLFQFTPDQIKAAIAYQPPAGSAKPTPTEDDDVAALLKRLFRN